MKKLLLVSFFLLSLSVFSQEKTATDSNLIHHLVGGSYSDLIVFIEDTNYTKKNTQFYESLSVNDTALFSLGFTSDIEDKANYTISGYRLNDSILLGRLVKYYDGKRVYSIAKSTNDSGFRLKPKSVSESEIYVYGTLCGFALGEPIYHQALNEQLQKRSYSLFDEWLVSSHPELQAYAVEGFYRSGIKLTKKQRSLISAIKKDKTSIRTCSGSTYGYETLISVLIEFKF